MLKYTKEQIEFAGKLLQKSSLPRDALPYTQEFEDLHIKFNEANERLDKHTFWLLLSRAGKMGGARHTKKGRVSPRKIPALTQEDAFELLRLCPENIGSRDRLPYTTEFDDIYKHFCEHTGKRLTKNEFWRSLSRLAKRSRKPTPVNIAENIILLPKPITDHLFRLNPWWKGEHGKPVPDYRRTIYETLYRKYVKGSIPILAVRGPRQVGKTTLQLQVIQDLMRTQTASPNRILRVQFDDLPSLGNLSDPILSIITWYEKTILQSPINEAAKKKKPVFLFFDEVQDLKAWDSQLKALVDNTTCHVYITGSSALRIQEGRDSLAGRIQPCNLGTLSLVEIAGFRKYHKLKPFESVPNPANWLKMSFWQELSNYNCNVPFIIDSVFREFDKFGGYPHCHCSHDREWVEVSSYLNELMARNIDHDLRIGSNRKRDRSSLRSVFNLALRYAGQAPTASFIAEQIRNTLNNTITPAEVINYLDFLENSLLLKLIRPLEARVNSPTAPPKICLCDHAFRTAFLKEQVSLLDSDDANNPNLNMDIAGHIVESVVGYSLDSIEGINLSYQPARKGEDEIDLIITIGDKRIPIEIKYRPNPLKHDFTNGLERFMANKYNNASFGIVISKNEAGIKNNIVAVPLRNFLLLH